MRDRNRCQANGFHASVCGSQFVKLGVQLGRLRSGEPASGFTAFDIGLDVSGKVKDEANACSGSEAREGDSRREEVAELGPGGFFFEGETCETCLCFGVRDLAGFVGGSAEERGAET